MAFALHHVPEEDPAVAAASYALSECDHSRLPVWMVARIAVESARNVFDAEIAEMRAELTRLRGVSRLATA